MIIEHFPYSLTLTASDKNTLYNGVGNKYPVGAELLQLLYHCKSGLSCKLKHADFPLEDDYIFPDDMLEYDETYLMKEHEAWEIAELITDALEEAGGNFLPLLPKPLNDKLILFTMEIV
jgi:hypothetical protein